MISSRKTDPKATEALSLCLAVVSTHSDLDPTEFLHSTTFPKRSILTVDRASGASSSSGATRVFTSAP